VGAIVQQEDENNDWDLCCYESGLLNQAEKRYDTGKREFGGLMNACEMVHNLIYGVRFLVVTDANTLVHQLILPANDMQEALVACWIVWI